VHLEKRMEIFRQRRVLLCALDGDPLVDVMILVKHTDFVEFLI
jgi:hypothetical protein